MAHLKSVGRAELREVAATRVVRYTLRSGGVGELKQRKEQSTERVVLRQQRVPPRAQVGGGDARGERQGDE